MVMKNILVAGVLALGSFAAVAPAQATDSGFSVRIQIGQPHHYGYQPHYGYHAVKPVYQRTLSPRQVRNILRSRGYEDIRYVDRRGSVYRVRAERNGRDFRLVVNAYTGRIIDRDRV